MSLIINLGLWKGVKRQNMGYIVPWLVVVAIALLALPMYFLWLFFDSRDEDQLVGIISLSVGLPLCKDITQYHLSIITQPLELFLLRFVVGLLFCRRHVSVHKICRQV